MQDHEDLKQGNCGTVLKLLQRDYATSSLHESEHVASPAKSNLTADGFERLPSLARTMWQSLSILSVGTINQ